MKVILLGTGTPVIGVNNLRAGSSATIMINDNILLFDCGRWITLRLCQVGIHPRQVSHFFFTHIFHFDHTCNYYDFLMAANPEKLSIYGPRGTKEYTEELLNLHAKYGEGRGKPILNWAKNHTIDLEKGTICSGDNWKVDAVNINENTNWQPTIIYRVEHGNFSTVIAWDIHPVHPRRQGKHYESNECYTSRKELMKLMDGADLVLADAMDIHTTPEGIGIAAEKAEVKKLVLTHLSGPGTPWPPIEPAIIKDRVKKVFSGEVIIGEDLMEIKH